MPGFVGKGKVPIALTEEIDGEQQTNTIYVRDKMGYGARQRVRGSAARNITQDTDGTVNMDLNFGQANITLLFENIVDWTGPQFEDERGKKVPVTMAAIEDLDPEWELIDMVLAKIQELNLVAPKDVPDPNAFEPVGNGHSSSGTPTGPLATLILK